MKAGDLVRVKDIAAYGNVFMQSIVGQTGIVLEVCQKMGRVVVMLCERERAYKLPLEDFEVIK